MTTTDVDYENSLKDISVSTLLVAGLPLSISRLLWILQINLVILLINVH